MSMFFAIFQKKVQKIRKKSENLLDDISDKYKAYISPKSYNYQTYKKTTKSKTTTLDIL